MQYLLGGLGVHKPPMAPKYRHSKSFPTKSCRRGQVREGRGGKRGGKRGISCLYA